ncbi:FtsW/RodA/SpoVE family cell cycle protein, partial [Patescibacteria group bacterium]|nr:FtsW/RodA/SpoVE family cell cycle protein [Patescibacteria group bacterium]
MLKRISFFSNIDWWLFFSLMLISFAGLTTMNSFTGVSNSSFDKQIVWLIISVTFFLGASFIDWRFIRRTNILVWLFVITIAVMLAVKIFGVNVHGSESWFRIGGISF